MGKDIASAKRVELFEVVAFIIYSSFPSYLTFKALLPVSVSLGVVVFWSLLTFVVVLVISTSGTVIFSANLSSSPLFHLEKAVASSPTVVPDAVAPILIWFANLGPILVLNFIFFKKFDDFVFTLKP